MTYDATNGKQNAATLRAIADVLDPGGGSPALTPPPPAMLLSPRLKFVGYQKWPVTLDENPYGNIAVNPTDGHLFAIGRLNRTLFEVQSIGWDADLGKAPRAALVKAYGETAFAGLVAHDVVQGLYHDGTRLWWTKAQNYDVAGKPAPVLGFYAAGKAYGPWLVDVGEVRIRHFISQLGGRLVAGAGIDSGSEGAPWGLGLSYVEAPDETTPATNVLATQTLAFNDINHRLSRLGDYVPQNNPHMFPAPVNGQGLWTAVDYNRAVAVIGDTVLFMPSMGTGKVGYKIPMPDGQPAPGQYAWGHRAEWQAVKVSDLLGVAAGTTKPYDVQPYERFDPQTVYGLQMPADCGVNGACVVGNQLVVQMHGLDLQAGGASPSLVTACFDVS